MTSEIDTIRLMGETLDSLGVAVCLFDDTPSTLYWNHSFLELFPEHAGRVRVGEPYSANLERFYRVRLPAEEQQHIARYVADGIERHIFQRLPYVFEHHGQWLRVASLPVPGVGRVRIWTPIASPDASDAIRYALAVTNPSAANPAIADVADGLMLRDAAGVITSVNKRFMLLYRIDSLQEAIGTRFENLLERLWGDDPHLADARLALADNQRFAGAPFEIPLPGQRWIRISEQPTRDGGLVSTHADVTEIRQLQRAANEARQRAEATNQALLQQIGERERAEAALLQAQRVEAVGQLTGGIAHDFNNLLSVVLGNVELLEAHETDPSRKRRLSVIRDAAERGAALTGQLLAFSRQQPLQPRPVDLNILIAGMKDLLGSALGSEVVLDLVLPTETRQALVDPTQIELVILNLAINARDAMDGRGTLRIATRNEIVTEQSGPDAPAVGGYVCISVTDDGAGMAPSVLARAFEPFFTTKTTGSGLGLSQVYGLARQSSGLARIQSAPGAGTTVEVILPWATATAAGSVTRAPRLRAESAGACVLVVDDNVDLLATTCTVLRGLGYVVLAAEDGISALEQLGDNPGIAVLLTDVSMPGMTGPELALRVRALRPGLPVVFFSGFSDPANLAAELRPCRLLRKPVRVREFREAIEAALAAP